jgi:membrane protein DedA with SNARE-associated domain
MIDTIHELIERYGLIAIFAGTILEGETAAILGGFFAHQGLFSGFAAFLAAALGAFASDCLFFLLGRRFAGHPFVARLRAKPGFSHANAMLRAHPNVFIIANRFVYGMRLAGGVAAGLSEIGALRFVVLNAISALIWAAIFYALGYFFGLGAEALLGDLVHRHHRLLVGLGLGVVSLAAAWLLTRHFSARLRTEPEA